jgi:hypothetical protein
LFVLVAVIVIFGGVGKLMHPSFSV